MREYMCSLVAWLGIFHMCSMGSSVKGMSLILVIHVSNLTRVLPSRLVTIHYTVWQISLPVIVETLMIFIETLMICHNRSLNRHPICWSYFYVQDSKDHNNASIAYLNSTDNLPKEWPKELSEYLNGEIK